MKKILVGTEEQKMYLEAIQKRERVFWMGIAFFALAVLYVTEYQMSKFFVYSYLWGSVFGAILGGSCLFYWYLQGAPSISVTEKTSPIDKFIQVKELIFQIEAVVQCVEMYKTPGDKPDEKETARISLLVKNIFEKIKNSPYTKDL